MTEIEQKALALAIEVREDARMRLCPDPTLIFGNWEALCRAIEQHDAFRQEVSTEMLEYSKWCKSVGLQFPLLLERFIIAKPDPLAECLLELDLSEDEQEARHDAEWLVKTIEKRGGKIVWGEG